MKLLKTSEILGKRGKWGMYVSSSGRPTGCEDPKHFCFVESPDGKRYFISSQASPTLTDFTRSLGDTWKYSPVGANAPKKLLLVKDSA